MRQVMLAARWQPLPVTCLTRALVAQRALRRQQLDIELRIGVHKANDSLKAHAWLVLDGYALDPQSHHFEPLDRPSERAR